MARMKPINEAVSRDKFPNGYMFSLQVSEKTATGRKFLIGSVSSNTSRRGKAFTKKGFIMWLQFLRSPRTTATTFAILNHSLS